MGAPPRGHSPGSPGIRRGLRHAAGRSQVRRRPDIRGGIDESERRLGVAESIRRAGHRGAERRPWWESATARASAVMVLAQSGDASTYDMLVTALNDEDRRVRAAATYNLGRLGDLRAVAPLIAA